MTDIEAVVADLAYRRVKFEDCDLGEIKDRVDRLADFGMSKAAWFKDTEGNNFELRELVGS